MDYCDHVWRWYAITYAKEMNAYKREVYWKSMQYYKLASTNYYS